MGSQILPANLAKVDIHAVRKHIAQSFGGEAPASLDPDFVLEINNVLTFDLFIAGGEAFTHEELLDAFPHFGLLGIDPRKILHRKLVLLWRNQDKILVSEGDSLPTSRPDRVVTTRVFAHEPSWQKFLTTTDLLWTLGRASRPIIQLCGPGPGDPGPAWPAILAAPLEPPEQPAPIPTPVPNRDSVPVLEPADPEPASPAGPPELAEPVVPEYSIMDLITDLCRDQCTCACGCAGRILLLEQSVQELRKIMGRE